MNEGYHICNNAQKTKVIDRAKQPKTPLMQRKDKQIFHNYKFTKVKRALQYKKQSFFSTDCFLYRSSLK